MASKSELEQEIYFLSKEVERLSKTISDNLHRDTLEVYGEECLTLSGKVNAIIDHLGIDITIQPRKVTPAKPVAKKLKKGKK